ncbi:cyclin-dependent protein serine/threonine kinase regulator [Saccharomycopsis crataegensis]|uniref:Cyclin-dependent protein serine/threonine kinase regulator n=1 Tax=Saccharomycopsis crataegensis TaxID=43959 RepID=A0AAV5QJI0_9ASCO|nr:cyclin-dependent protein serine/threonine kinase regulator [Saccharomycopsis crataegensis]
MSANYWNSSQRLHWQFTREELSEKRRNIEVLENQLMAAGALPLHLKDIEYDYNMRIYLHNLVHKLGRRLGLRAIPITTAEVYLSRFLLNVSLKEINIYLLVTTCIYLACKVEECPHHIRSISNEARNLWPQYIPHDLTKLAEFEFYLIEEMENYLIIHNPYRSLGQIRNILASTDFAHIDNYNSNNGMNNIDGGNNGNYRDGYKSYGDLSSGLDPSNGKLYDGVNCLILHQDELQVSWSIINDSYITDLSLIFPPHIISLGAIYIAVVLRCSAMMNDRASSAILRRAGVDLPNKPGTTNTGPNIEGRMNILTNFMGISNIDLNEVIEAVQEILTLYEVWEAYDENKLRKKVQKLFMNR